MERFNQHPLRPTYAQPLSRATLGAFVPAATRLARAAVRPWGTACLALSLTACVTINIYFPAAAAEKAADQVIDEIWQTPASPNKPSAPVSPANSSTTSGQPDNQEATP